MRDTGEIFTDYEKYLERYVLLCDTHDVQS